MAGGNPGPIWVRGPFLLASDLFLLHGANGRTRGKRQPPACPGPGRQAQSRNSALTQMTQGISGSGARRWSVRKPCRAAQVQEISARCLLYRGGRERPPASLWSLSGRSERDPTRRAGTSRLRKRPGNSRTPSSPLRSHRSAPAGYERLRCLSPPIEIHILSTVSQ